MLEWLFDNAPHISMVIAGAHAVAVAITNMTDTPKDDAVVAKVYRVVEVAAGIFRPSKVKQ